MTTLNNIEQLTKAYADARSRLAERVQVLEDELETIKRRKLPGIKSALNEAAAAEDRLRAAVEGSPELFVRPRTVIFHGVRVGMQKGRGEITWDDEAQVMRLIERHLPDRVEDLVKVIRRPLKTALARLSVAELRRIGVTVIETGDQVVIKPTDSQLEKMVDALLKDASDPERAVA